MKFSLNSFTSFTLLVVVVTAFLVNAKPMPQAYKGKTDDCEESKTSTSDDFGDASFPTMTFSDSAPTSTSDDFGDASFPTMTSFEDSFSTPAPKPTNTPSPTNSKSSETEPTNSSPPKPEPTGLNELITAEQLSDAKKVMDSVNKERKKKDLKPVCLNE